MHSLFWAAVIVGTPVGVMALLFLFWMLDYRNVHQHQRKDR